MNRASSRSLYTAMPGMNIVHVIITLDPRHGGPPMIAAGIAAAQAQLGHDVSIIATADADRLDVIDKATRDIPGFQKVRLHQLPSPRGIEKFRASQARRKLDELVPRADAVHLHSIWESIIRVGAERARHFHKPYFILVNGMLHPWSLQQSALKKRVAMSLFYRRMFNGAAALHVGNEAEKRVIAPLKLKPPSVVIPNGVFLEEFADLPSAHAFHDAHPELQGKPYILFLSRLHYKKGLDYLADAFAKVAARHGDVQLVVAGPDGGERANFEQRIQAAGISQRVHIVGPQYGRDKLAALAGAVCFCLPSRQEGFSVAITEALACGLPVVNSEDCNFPEVATQGAGFVTPLDAGAVAEALCKIIENHDARRGMSLAGRQYVERNLTWPIVAEKTVAMYEQAIPRSARMTIGG